MKTVSLVTKSLTENVSEFRFGRELMLFQPRSRTTSHTLLLLLLLFFCNLAVFFIFKTSLVSQFSILTLEGKGKGRGVNQTPPSIFLALHFFPDRLPKALAQLFFVC